MHQTESINTNDITASFQKFLEEEKGFSPNSASRYVASLTNIRHDLVHAIPIGSNLLQEVEKAYANGEEDVFYRFNHLLTSAFTTAGPDPSKSFYLSLLLDARISLRDLCAHLSKKYAKSGLKRIGNVNQIDGYDELITLFSGTPSFIRAIIDQCYFFAPEVVQERHNDMVNILEPVDILTEKNNKNRLSARRSAKKAYYCGIEVSKGDKNVSFNLGNGRNISIDIDKSGNYDVCKIINDLTACTLNKGEKSHFFNYTISHIWGNAWHPYYFTSLWNIVLVPSYINCILDKSTAKKHKDTWPCILFDTIQAIIIELYGLKNYDWKQFAGLNKTKNTARRQAGTYTIKVINLKSPGQNEPEISAKQVTI